MIEQKTMPRTPIGTRRVRHTGARTGLRRTEGRRVIGLVEVAEDVVHYAVSVLLVIVSAVVMFHSLREFLAGNDHPFPERVTSVINTVLFVIIVMEILRTVVAHFDDAGLQLKPFLIIGIISAVRHILTVGAQTSLGGDTDAEHFGRAQIELGANAAVVLVLVLGLVMIWRSERAGPDFPESDTTKGLA